MYELTVNSCVEHVKTILDELINTGEMQMIAPEESTELTKLVQNTIVPAAIQVQTECPAEALVGLFAEKGADYQASLSVDGVISISMLKPTLRIASFKADGEVTNEILSEASPEGKKQLNKFIRGNSQKPRLVLQSKWNGENKPNLKYYSTTETNLDNLTIELQYIPYPVLKNGAVGISALLEQHVKNRVAALVLTALNEQKGEFYMQLSKVF